MEADSTLCERHIANLAAFCARHDQPADETQDPLWIAYTRSLDAISASQPSTVAGCVALARAAQEEARNLDGSLPESTDHTVAGRWGMTIIATLARLEGGAA